MRSLLFVPGDSNKKLQKGLASSADCLLLDLEDSVATKNKGAARKITSDFIKSANSRENRPRLFVRINAFDTEFTDEDLEAVVLDGLDGIMLPKSLSGNCVDRLASRLSVYEAKRNLPEGQIQILAIATETAASLFTLGTYVSVSTRLKGMAWGAEDLSADLGAETNKNSAGDFTDPYRLARTLCLAGACAAAVQPIDTVYTNFTDMDGLQKECEEARRDGYTGKMAIHPAQLDTINSVFTPSRNAIEHARRVIAAFDTSANTGVVGLDGEMLDKPHLRRAHTVLERANQKENRTG